MGKHIFSKLLNADDAAHVLEAAELINLENLRWGTTDEGEVGALENMKGTTLRYQPRRNGAVVPQLWCIGATADEARQLIVWFTHAPATAQDPQWDAIWLFDRSTGNTYPVLDSTKVALGFRRDKLIHSAAIVNGSLYWTDDNREPRMVHLGTAIKMMTGSEPLPALYDMAAPLREQDIALIKKPFSLAPTLEKIAKEGRVVNLIEAESFRFGVQYVYWGGEKTVLSPWSKASKVNSVADTAAGYNCIRVTLPAAEAIPQGVKIVRLVVLLDSTQRAFVVKEWSRLAESDRMAIDDHNGGVKALEYEFFNNAVGEALGEAEVALLFHSVPEVVRTLAAARNRLFLGNYREGRDAPAKTSLELLPSSGGTGPVTVPLRRYEYESYGDPFQDPDTGERFQNMACTNGYVVYLVGAGQDGWYGLKDYQRQTYSDSGTFPLCNTLPAPPAEVTMNDLVYYGPTTSDIIAATNSELTPGIQNSDNIIFDTGATIEVAVVVVGEPGSVATQFKSGGEYEVGIVFYDAYLRRCSVVKALRIEVPSRDYNFGNRVSSFIWRLLEANRLDEIPDWAHYYAIVRTLNLKTRFFVQGITYNLDYWKKDPVSGEWKGGVTVWDEDVQALGFTTASLEQAGLGYNFAEGDVCRLLDTAGNSWELAVIGVVNGRVLVKPAQVTLSGTYAFEIYTPYKPVGHEPYYEVGEVFPIENPGTSNRRYSVVTGVLYGDAFVLGRTYNGATYYSEAMSPNDKYWKRWVTDAGRVNIVTSRGAYRNATGVRFSDVFIPGTDTNGLSAFMAANKEDLPLEMGELMKLQLASKAQSEGTVLLGIGMTETVSIYLGEAQLTADDNSLLVRTKGVIGDIRILQGSLGTLHPESVALRDGRVFWLDVLNGVIASYSAGGLFPVSNYKLRRAARLLCARLRSAEFRGVPIPGGVSPYHGEYVFTAPQTEAVPPKGMLEDYSSREYPYDFYDGKEKTWVYKIDFDRSGGAHRYAAEYFVSLGGSLFSFKNGTLWEHDSAAEYDSFYGQTVRPALAFVENGEPDSSVKVFAALAVEASMAPDFTHIRTEVPHVQSSDLLAEDWKPDEGIFKAGILRDRLSPNTPGSAEDKLLFGDPMRGQWAKILMEFSTGGQRLAVRFVNVHYRISKGHQTV